MVSGVIYTQIRWVRPIGAHAAEKAVRTTALRFRHQVEYRTPLCQWHRVHTRSPIGFPALTGIIHAQPVGARQLHNAGNVAAAYDKKARLIRIPCIELH